MDFHQTAAERFAERVFKYISKEFDGKVVNSEECNIELMLKHLSKDVDDVDLADIPATEDEVDTPVDEEPFEDSIDSPKAKTKSAKKAKKEKKTKSPDDPEKKKNKKPNPYLYFRMHPDNQGDIETKAQEPHPDKPDKPMGKVKSASVLWNGLSVSDKEEWSVRCNAAHAEKLAEAENTEKPAEAENAEKPAEETTA